MSKEDPGDGTVDNVDIAAAKNSSAAGNIPKCVCTWKNCRLYQKLFRDHPVWDGVIRLKFTSTEPEAMALKASIDRNLSVPKAKANDWKSNKDGSKVCKYNVACHHWTEQHILKFRLDSTHYSFTKPFSCHGAKKYLHKVDPRETVKDPSGRRDELLYLQSPLVPKEDVRILIYALKEAEEKGVGGKSGFNRARSKGKIIKDDDDEDCLHQQRQQSPQMPQQRGNSVSVGRSCIQSKPHHLQAKGEKGTTRCSTQVERKDSLTVSTNQSGKTAEVLLQEKELENKRLMEQLAALQSEISFLYDVLSKLQEEHYDRNFARGGPRDPDHRSSSGYAARRRMTESGQGADRHSRRTGSRSSRSSVPNEIEIESEDDGKWVDGCIDEKWSVEDRDEDDRSQGTCHANSTRFNSSFSSKASTRSRATSIISSSKSLKSLPREIELDEDDDSQESLEDVRVPAKSVSRRNNKSHGVPDDNPMWGVRQVTAILVTDPYGEQGTYTGSISDSSGMPHGFGRLEYEKVGRWYEGHWRHGQWSGQGRLSNGDGDFYEGGLKNDQKHGKGVMKFSDGRTFDGYYANGQMVEGKMTYQDGSSYVGRWVDGMRHGRGRCVFTDQSVYEGEFREGEFCGFGRMTWSDGGWYEGDWCNGEMHGFGKEIRPDGSLRHEGQWAKGQPVRR